MSSVKSNRAAVWGLLVLSCGTNAPNQSVDPARENPPAAPVADAGGSPQFRVDAGSPNPTTPLFLLSTSPRSGATLVYAETPFVATFSEPLDPTSANPTSVRVSLEPAAGAPVPVAVTIAAAAATLTVTPVVPFETNAVFSVTITTAIRGQSGATLARDARSSFTTRPWTIQTGTEYGDNGIGVAVDAIGNVFLGGGTSGNLHGLTLHETPGENAGDGFLSKYKPSGEREWTRLVGSSSGDGIGAVAVTPSGEIVIAGTTSGPVDAQPHSGGYDVVVAKFDTNGSRLWTKQFGSEVNDYGSAVAVDANGNVLVAVETSGSIGDQRNLGISDIAVVKLSPAGAWLWAKQLGSAYDEIGGAIATDSAGNVFVAAITFGTFPGQRLFGDMDAVLAKLDSSGNLTWARQLGTPQKDVAVGVAVDSAGAAYLSGWTLGGLDGHPSAGDSDTFVVKYGATGAKLWSRQFGTTRGDSASMGGIAIRRNGGVVVTGVTYGSLDGTTRQTAGDGYLVAFDSDGTQLWLRQFGTTQHDYPAALATSADGSFFVTGYTYGTFSGNSGMGDTDAFLMKLNPDGIPR
ncbi:MAG: SBBP repeat-containing protein [Deltaproteobacteria bacterium]|nr:SBBP repeat-containing protein [Deltaproteobacteria bacterium]